MNQILALDVGNSRLKWGMAGRHGWSATGSVPNSDIGTLALTHWQNMPKPGRVVGVNVTGESGRLKVEAQMVRWRINVEWITPQRTAAGITNNYANPAQLGSDRWAALAAARQRQCRAVPAGSAPAPCLVISFGTAITIDALTADGTFLGGLILPGFTLMRSRLAASTVALSSRLPMGRYADFPTSSEDALYSGALQAIRGAIASMRAQLAAQQGQPEAPILCIIAGGDAPDVLSYLTEPLMIVDNLVLEGVLVLTAPEIVPK